MSNSNLTEDLRAYVSALADDADSSVEFPVPEAEGPSSVRRPLVAAAAVAVIALFAAFAFTLAAGGDEGGLATEGGSPDVTPAPEGPDPVDGTTGDPSEGSAPGSGSMSVLPDVPLDVRGDVATVWTGDELVVWGGDVEAFNMGLPGEDRQYADGAVFNPESDEWRPMSAGPLPESVETPVAVATDDGVVIARGTSVARWHPADDAWQALPNAPRPVRDLAWTGGSVVSASANAVLDFDSDAWRTVDLPPVELERPTPAWTGAELVVVGGPSTPFASAVAIALDPQAGTWRRLPDPPDGLHAEALSAAWDGAGERVVVVNYDMQAVSYDPAGDAWTRMPAVPARFSEWYPVLESAQGYSVALMAQTVAVMAPDGRWVPLAYGDLVFGSTAVAGDVPGAAGPVLYTVGIDDTRDRIVVTALDIPAASGAPDALQVGGAAIAVPDGFTLTGAEFDSDGAEAVIVELDRNGNECLITSTYGAHTDPDGVPMMIDETLPGTPDVAWRRDKSGTAWATGLTTTDILRIRCDVPENARLLASSVRP